MLCFGEYASFFITGCDQFFIPAIVVSLAVWFFRLISNFKRIVQASKQGIELLVYLETVVVAKVMLCTLQQAFTKVISTPSLPILYPP